MSLLPEAYRQREFVAERLAARIPYAWLGLSTWEEKAFAMPEIIEVEKKVCPKWENMVLVRLLPAPLTCLYDGVKLQASRLPREHLIALVCVTLEVL